MTSIAIKNRTTLFERSENTGSSSVSMKLQDMFDDAIASLKKKSYTWSHVDEALKSLLETYSECATDGWDGYDADAINESTYSEAVKFLNLLPSWISLPEIVAEPTGEVGFEWSNNKGNIFAASVNGAGSLAFAGLMGKGNRLHGTVNFYDSIPPVIIENIRNIQ